MRFDDMLATVLAQPATSAAGRSAKWRQLVDLLAQPGRGSDSEALIETLIFLRAHRAEIDLAVRREVAQALAGRRVAPMLVAFFGEDQPSVAAPVVNSVLLEADDWLALLPILSITARALLRHRRDLDPKVTQALAAFGAIDFVLTRQSSTDTEDADAPATAEPTAEFLNPAAEAGEAQIRDLMARIEAYRRERAAPGSAEQLAFPPLEHFRWEAGPDGVILWVEDAPRGPLIGHTIATIASSGQQGVDGQAAGAFHKRAPFRDARFTVSGSGPASGAWRLSGVPFFDSRRGTFLGYRGTARRPRVDEVARPGLAAAGTSGLFGTNLPPESLRQLVHELRTPLNAILGFAEMIEGQFMGPAGASYRGRASEIRVQATRLLSAVDDLDTAARLETQKLVVDQTATDLGVLLGHLQEAYRRVAGQRGAEIVVSAGPELPPAKVDLESAERMIARLLAGTIGLARDGETIHAAIGEELLGSREMLCLAIDRPQAIVGLEEESLLDPGYSPEGDWPGAPALGLGFALRLVRNLAEAAGGTLSIGYAQFFLYLPSMKQEERSSGQN